MARKKRANHMEQADVLFSRFIRARDGRCQNCGSFERLQCAHLITRSYKSIRVNPDNAVALCSACHTYYTHHPLEWREWCDVEFPGRLETLTRQALTYERVNWRAELESLRTVMENQ